MQTYHYCHASCACHALRQDRAVNMRYERGPPYHPPLRPSAVRPLAPQRPSIHYHPPVAYPQAHPQRYDLIFIDRPDYYAMAVQAGAGGATTPELQHGYITGRPNTPVFPSQPPLVHPQVGHPFPSKSFFEDEYDNCHAEEATLFNPTRNMSAQSTIPHSMAKLAQPCAPTTLPPIANDVTASKAEASHVDVPIMPLVHTNVDTAMFEPLKSEHWQRASLDFGSGHDSDAFAMSPASTEDTSCGPLTPHDSSGFTEAGLRRISHDLSSSFDSSGADMFEEHGADMKFPSFSDVGSGIGTHFGSQSTHYGSLPFPGSSFGGLSDLPLNEGSFHDVDGLPPIFPAITPITEEHDGSVTSRTVPKTKRRRSTERDREAILRERRDQYLLDRREEGFTYKDIKVMGNFPEAESTLRGRVRVLTKDRSERVRKPVWTGSDVRLLRRGVAHARKLRTEGAYNRTRSTKLPWKYIAEYVEEHGGSYSFAPATCAKKWDELR